MVKGILVKSSELLTDDEQLEIQKQFKNNNIEVIFWMIKIIFMPHLIHLLS